MDEQQDGQQGRLRTGRVVIDSCHQTTGHSGVNRSAKYIRRWFWWPGMADNVEEFCKSCGRCQTTKTPRDKRPGWLHTMPIPARPWESIGMDFTGPFVEVGGYNYILLVICRMTVMVHLIPTQTNATAKQVAEIYVKEVVRLHGIPESIVSDRDTKFTSQFWKELSKILGQRLLMSTSYHPQTDGSSEQAIQVMSQMLQLVINDYQMNWVE
jgi:transposase InsO family protein